MSKSLTEVAKNILMNENANQATLKPGGASQEPPKTLGSATKIADAPVMPNGTDGNNVGSTAAAPVKKDTSKSSQSGHDAGETAPRKSSPKGVTGGEIVAEEENLEEDENVEISEELKEFIDSMVAEGLSEEEILAAIDENFEFVTEESEETVSEEEKKEKKEKKSDKKDDDVKEYGVDGERERAEKGDVYEFTVEIPVIDMKEHVEALLAGESLSEEFKQKATTIFEAAVKTKVEEQMAILEESYEKALDEAIETIKGELSEHVDGYLNYVVEQWATDNEVAIESGLRTELTEDFISGLRNLFAEHYIDIPEDKVSVVEEMSKKVAELEEKLNEEIDRSVALTTMLNESKQNEILNAACAGLTETQASKLKSLAEGVEFNSANDFKEKLKTLKESYFTSSVKSDNVLDTVDSSDGKTMISENLTGPMEAYVKTLGRMKNVS